MGLVCRPIKMYNEYVPAITGMRTWKYHVLGNHDGMDIGEPVRISETEMKSFQDIFNAYIQKEALGDYAVQIYFGLHNDDGKEEEFWSKETVFTFVSFIQFKEKEINKYHRYLEGQTCDSEECSLSLRAYYTMDCNDSILVIKCDRYAAGARFIHQLNQNMEGEETCEIRNSYSVLAFERDAGSRQIYNEKPEEILEKVELRIIESYRGSIEGLYNKLKKKLNSVKGVTVNRYGMFGTDDGAIILENIPCRDFLNLYTDGGGILCNSNEKTQEYAAAITTKVMFLTGEPSGVEKTIESHKGEKAFSMAMEKYIKHYYKGRESMAECAEKKMLLKVAHALGKIEYARNKKEMIAEYNFFTLILPFYFFMVLHVNAEGHSNEYYKFLTYFNICTQNYDKPDRVFVQTTDFNIRYFEMQTKYFTLYSAFIYRLKHLLNVQSDKKYEFILCPGMSERTEVTEFHRKENERYRLIKVAIAETRMYDVKSMLCILGHEVAHLVGGNIRSRENRYAHFVKMNSHVIVLAFQNYFREQEFTSVLNDSEIWQEYETKMYEWLTKYIARNNGGEYWQRRSGADEEMRQVVSDYIGESQKYKFYTENMKDTFEKAIRDMLKRQGTEIFEDAFWTVFEDDIKNNVVQYEDKGRCLAQYHQILEKIIDSFAEENADFSHAFHISKVMDTELYLLRECYADLISILTLQLTIEEYLSTIAKEMLNVGCSAEEVRNTDLIARIALVMSVMHYKDEDSQNYFRWENEDLINDSEVDGVMLLQEEALDFMGLYISNDLKAEADYLVEDSRSIVYDNFILREIISYLLHCRQKFYRETEAEALQAVKDFKRVTQYQDEDEFYTRVMKLIVEYETDIYQELEVTAREIEEEIQREQKNGTDTERSS